MDINLSNIMRRHEAQSRSLSPENFRAEKGKGGMATAETTYHAFCAAAAAELGQGWKVSPFLIIPAGETAIIMDNDGPGIIRHMWMALDRRRPTFLRDVILRMYWDGDDAPSVECPIGDFFCNAWGQQQNIVALPINANSSGGMNCFLPMPFKRHARITVENDSPHDLPVFAYSINYTLEPVPDDVLNFHAQWRRSNPLAFLTPYVMLDGVQGQGHYIGTFMAWQQNSAGWWGEGEIKMYIDGDSDFPTICGTGTEDYFGGAWGFQPVDSPPKDYSAPYLGFQQVQGVSGQPGTRMTLYRFHLPDPVFFKSDLKVTMQALGWRSEQRYLPLQDDISSVVYWYQTLPHAPLPPLPERNLREVV